MSVIANVILSVYHLPNLTILCCCRWVVENQIGKKDLIIEDCDAKQSVYVYGCKDSVLQIQGGHN